MHNNVRRGCEHVKKLKIYLETSIFGRYFEKEEKEHKATFRLFEEIKQDKYEAYASVYVLTELKKTKEKPRRLKLLSLIKDYNINFLETSEEDERLMKIYIKEGMIPKSKEDDAFHIASASINNLDLIVSVNFQDINKLKVKKMVKFINKREGYEEIKIVEPMEVVVDEKI